MTRKAKDTKPTRSSKQAKAQPQITTSDEARKRLADLTGENVQAMEPRWLNLLTEGVIVELHIRRWRGKTALSPADLGIGNSDQSKRDVVGDLLSLGEKKLLPPATIKALDSVDSWARKVVKEWGFDTYWGVFVPVTAYRTLRARLNELEREYLAIRDNIADNLDTIKTGMREAYKFAAINAYRRIRALDAGALMSDGRAISEDDFIERYTDAILSQIPGAETIRESFAFEVEVRYVPLPSLLAGDRAKAATLLADQERQAALRVMNDEVAREARAKKTELVNGFMADVTGQLRALIYGAAVDVLETMDKNGKGIHPRSVVQMRHLVAKVSALNFTDDADIRKMTGIIERHAASGSTRDAEALREALRNMATVTRASLLMMNRAPDRKARHVGVAVDPDAATVRQARESLGLADVAPLIGAPRKRRALS